MAEEGKGDRDCTGRKKTWPDKSVPKNSSPKSGYNKTKPTKPTLTVGGKVDQALQPTGKLLCTFPCGYHAAIDQALQPTGFAGIRRPSTKRCNQLGFEGLVLRCYLPQFFRVHNTLLGIPGAPCLGFCCPILSF